MGIEDETNRTLFIGNVDQRVTEELLFELFLQAGPLIKTIIPKDSDGKQKSFGFAVYKHEVSVPYAMQLLNGTRLHGRTLHVQFRSGSSHNKSLRSSPANTPNPYGQQTSIQFSGPSCNLPNQMQRSFSSPDDLQKHTIMNNVMWQLHLQQLNQLNGGFSKPLQRQMSAGGNSGRCGSRQHGNNPYQHQHQLPQMNSSGRNQQYADDLGAGRQQQQHGHRRDSYHYQKDRSGNRHHDGRGGSRHHDDGGSCRGYQDNRYRRY